MYETLNRTLIISQEKWELSTEQVMDWIWQMGGDVERLNGDIFEKLENDIAIKIASPDLLEIDGRILNLNAFSSVWFRRWGEEHYASRVKNSGMCSEFIYDIIYNLKSDNLTIRDLILSTLKGNSKKWLTDINKFTINKLFALDKANSCGFNIPKTLVTNEKSKLHEFYKECREEIITKDTSAPIAIAAFNRAYIIYAEKVSLDEINHLPAKFPMSLFQGEIEKEYEVRSFFLNDDIYSMAIFSQSDNQTKIDFRRYNLAKPNRNVPYKLPEEMEVMIRKFMTTIEYQTGSFDFIKGKDGKYYFLEINPIGQFGMVSSPCNYDIERKIAKFLMDNE
jgi:ATP-GRASP peptide maturase of grasp-with-spasm system